MLQAVNAPLFGQLIGRSHQARKIDFRMGRKLGPNERVQTYRKLRQQPQASRLKKGNG